MANQFQKFQERLETEVKNVKERIEKLNIQAEVEKVRENVKNFPNEVKEEVAKVRANVEQFPNEVKEEFAKVKANIENLPNEVKERIENFDANVELEKARENALKFNDFAVENADATLDAILKGGEKWTGVATKAVNVGLQMSEKNIDLVFNTLESAKEQMEGGVERFKGLFSKN